MRDSANDMSETILPLKAPLTDDQMACVNLLKEALAVALEGKVNTVGIVACMGDGYAHVMAGKQASNLNLGCDSLKQAILAEVEGGNVRRRATNIIRPVRQ